MPERRVTTEAELDALPTGSIIAVERQAWLKAGGKWWSTGSVRADTSYGLAAWSEPYWVLRYGDGTP